MQCVWRGGRLASGKFRRMWVMAGDAVFPGDRAHIPVPISTRATVGPSVPVSECWAVAAPAKLAAVGKFELPAVARLEELEIIFVVAICAEIVAVIATVIHDDVLVFLGNDQDMLVIKSKRWRLAFIVAAVAIKVGKILLGSNEL